SRIILHLPLYIHDPYALHSFPTRRSSDLFKRNKTSPTCVKYRSSKISLLGNCSNSASLKSPCGSILFKLRILYSFSKSKSPLARFRDKIKPDSMVLISPSFTNTTYFLSLKTIFNIHFLLYRNDMRCQFLFC